MQISRNRSRSVLPTLIACLACLALTAAASERIEAEQHVLYAQNVSAGTKVQLRPDFDAPRPKTATFVVDYIGFPQAARTAFQRAVDIWSAVLVSAVPIHIEAHWTAIFPGTPTPIPLDVLGATGAPFVRDVAPLPPAIWHVDALANELTGTDLFPEDVEVQMVLNSAFANWYLGVDGNPGAAQFDLVTVVLHEIGHGLGMSGVMRFQSGFGQWILNGVATTFPSTYDIFTEAPNGTMLANINAFPNPSIALGNALVDRVFFDGPQARQEHGSRPEIYAPNPFVGGSSYSHLDEDVFPSGDPDSLMTPQLALNEVIHDPGDLFLCLLEDLGWETAATCASDPPIGACVPDDSTFCLLDGRFAVEVSWRRFNGTTGIGQRVTGSDNSGLFYFFGPDNWEMLVKMVDACSSNSNHFWVFAAATTNVEYTLRVTDTEAGRSVSYFNPLGTSAAAITDTQAFATCP